MNDFWKNISRYPRFFISSLIGLILVILTPLRNLFKIKKFRFFLPIIFILFLGILYQILTNYDWYVRVHKNKFNLNFKVTFFCFYKN